jgi:hypothetical protein
MVLWDHYIVGGNDAVISLQLEGQRDGVLGCRVVDWMAGACKGVRWSKWDVYDFLPLFLYPLQYCVDGACIMVFVSKFGEWQGEWPRMMELGR